MASFRNCCEIKHLGFTKSRCKSLESAVGKVSEFPSAFQSKLCSCNGVITGRLEHDASCVKEHRFKSHVMGGFYRVPAFKQRFQVLPYGILIFSVLTAAVFHWNIDSTSFRYRKTDPCYIGLVWI